MEEKLETLLPANFFLDMVHHSMLMECILIAGRSLLYIADPGSYERIFMMNGENTKPSGAIFKSLTKRPVDSNLYSASLYAVIVYETIGFIIFVIIQSVDYQFGHPHGAEQRYLDTFR